MPKETKRPMTCVLSFVQYSPRNSRPGVRSDSDNDNSPSKTDDCVANRIQATSDETPAHDVTDRVLLPLEYGDTSAQDTDDNVTSQSMTAEIFNIPTGPSSPTATLSA
ncbi:hypothetical protein PoB_005262000 [Plakobranchus ocellatus]|uniref:Uncharacterized protein n=1 Tax=Plakobranchus ocellatus TaxID=259542 RepID=A0AAV4C405_9GAST|nr:hypothetical protein PoB_005262000 [Plakobranchus ocellatus]